MCEVSLWRSATCSFTVTYELHGKKDQIMDNHTHKFARQVCYRSLVRHVYPHDCVFLEPEQQFKA